MKSLTPILFALLISLTACKTQEDIRREKTVDSLNEQVAQTQKSTANANSRFTALEEQVAKLSGEFEESSHNRQQEIKDASLLKERLAGLEETNKKQTEFIRALNEKVQEQSKYIEEVIKSLKSLSEQKSQEPVATKAKKKENNSEEVATLKDAIAKYRARDLEAAKADLLQILENKKIKKKEKETAYYYLGMIEYRNKSYDEAKIYFSKLFSENPESGFGASSLLNLAKSFLQLKSKEEARQSLDELITRFPKSKEAQEGAKLKSKI